MIENIKYYVDSIITPSKEWFDAVNELRNREIPKNFNERVAFHKEIIDFINQTYNILEKSDFNNNIYERKFLASYADKLFVELQNFSAEVAKGNK